MQTLQQILAMPIFGNAHHDRPLFDAVHEFLMRDNPMPEKVQALSKLDKAMDSDAPLATEQDVNDYIQFILDEIAHDDPCPC